MPIMPLMSLLRICPTRLEQGILLVFAAISSSIHPTVIHSQPPTNMEILTHIGNGTILLSVPQATRSLLVNTRKSPRLSPNSRILEGCIATLNRIRHIQQYYPQSIEWSVGEQVAVKEIVLMERDLMFLGQFLI